MSNWGGIERWHMQMEDPQEKGIDKSKEDLSEIKKDCPLKVHYLGQDSFLAGSSQGEMVEKEPKQLDTMLDSIFIH